MIAVASVFLFIICFFVSGVFNQELLGHRNCCVCHVKLLIKSEYLITMLWISLKKEGYFNLNHSLGCLTYFIYHHQTSRSSLSFQLPDFFYLCSFYFYALMLVALWECKLPPLNDTGKDQNLTTNFEKILTFSLAWEFDLVLSLGVTTALITPVMGKNILIC